MKESKAVYVTRHKIRDDQKIVYQLNTNWDREYKYDCRNKNNDFACQFDSKKHACTCRNGFGREEIYFSKIPKQVYAYHGSRSFTDVGVGSVKALQRRKVKRVYLPETDDRGVGSSDLSAYSKIKKTRPYKGSFYDHKKTSSKCVGGIIEYNTGCVISEKLSPIVNTKSGTTSPKIPQGRKNIEIGSNTVVKKVETVGTQFEIDNKHEKDTPKTEDTKLETPSTKVCEPMQTYKNSSSIKKLDKKMKEAEKQFSSDSLVQHVHNLEIPSEDKTSRISMDPMENKLEREYRRMFATKENDSKPSCDKPIPEFKSASILRRRFEALRRGLTKRDDLKKSSFIPKSSQSRESSPSHKDASVTSDPPSLEARSYSDAKRYSPIHANIIEQERPRMNYRNERDSMQYATEMDSDCQGVRGMFKLWGKKFNLEEDYYEKKEPVTVPSYHAPKISEKEIEKKESKEKKPEPETKKEKRFFFFKKKSKAKPKDTYQEPPKKKVENVTAGRCEITEGLTIKMGKPSTSAPVPKEKTSKPREEGEEITRKRWLRRFLSSTIESARSVNVRWNNTTYATSSSTVFELIDTVYRNKEIFIRPHSEVTSLESYYKSNTKNKVNFIQDIEAWMIPKTIPDRPKDLPVKIYQKKDISQKNIELSYFNQKWLIDQSKALSHKIEVVLHSKNQNLRRKVSSDFLRIDIPKNFFDPSSDESKRNQTSDEEVYKIVEYETDTDSKKVKKSIRMEKGDNTQSDIKVIVSVKDSKNLESKILETIIKKPPTLRDVIIQGSNVNIPKRCDVIGVGIITQNDLRGMRKPLLKINVSSSDSDSPPLLNQKKCEFAESYLQEYYKHFTPLSLDLSSCVSDSHLRSCSEKSLSFHNQQGDGSKSCPNMCDDYQASSLISSYETSSVSLYNNGNDHKNSSKFVNFMKKKDKEKDNEDKDNKDPDNNGKRVLPKDSLEVFKKRKIYAKSNKCNWHCAEDKPVSVPSFESRGEQFNQDSKGGIGCRNDNCPNIHKPVLMVPSKKKTCKKHVSMPDCETMAHGLKKQLAETPGGILTFKGSVGCNPCKKNNASHKHTSIRMKPSLEIPEPPCKVDCEKLPEPACFQPGSPSCNVPLEDILCPQPHACPGMPPTPPPPKCPTCASSPKGPPSPPICNYFSESSRNNIQKESRPQPPCPCATEPPPNPPCPASISPYCQEQSCSPPTKDSPTSPLPSPPKTPTKPSPTSSRPSPPNGPCGAMKPDSRGVIPSCPALERPPPECQQPSQGNNNSTPKTSKHSSAGNEKAEKTGSSTSCRGCVGPNTKKTQKNKKIECNYSPPVPRGISACPSTNQASQCPSPESSNVCSKTSRDSPLVSPNSMTPVPGAVPIGPGFSLTGLPHPPKPPKPPKPKPPPKVSPCHRPPCSKIQTKPSKVDNKKSKSKQVGSDSDQSTPKTSGGCFKKIMDKIIDNKSGCKENCSMMKTTSGSFPDPSEPPDPPPDLDDCPSCECPSKVKVADFGCGENSPKKRFAGLSLRKNPSKKKTCAKDCPAWNNEPLQPGVVKLNSRENITINLKQQTPSTEEIRECMDVRVRGDDGRTLFERRDYNAGKNRSSVCGNVYDAQLNRISNPVMVTNLDSEIQHDVSNAKSEQSVNNLVEIHFKLRLVHGDKTTEINIGKEEDQEEKKEGIENAQEVYSVKNGERDEITQQDESSPKDDISIKIIVKNYKPKSQKRKPEKEKLPEDDFYNKISHKFNTVSTGYSDVYAEQTEENDTVFSVHRATVNLTSSTEKSKTYSAASNERSKIHSTVSNEKSKIDSAVSNERCKSHSSVGSNDVDDSIEPTEREPSNTKSKTSFTAPSLSTEELVLITEDEATDNPKTTFQAYDTHYEYLRETYSNYFNKAHEKELQKNPEMTVAVKSKEKVESKSKENTKVAKKELLKKVFQRAYSKPKSKGRVRQLRDMLKVILTDSSTNDDVTVTSNELAKDVTYTSLKPNYFKDRDSMKNYYKNESTISSLKLKSSLLEPNNYPTKENNSDETEEDSGPVSPTYRGCMCSKVVEKIKDPSLNISCCCRKKTKQDGEVNCDLYEDCNRIESIDAETQRSTVPSKVNSNKSTNVPAAVISKIKEITTNNIDKFFCSHTDSQTNKHPNNHLNTELDDEKPEKGKDNPVLTKPESKRAEKRKKCYHNNAADILQCYETKKAVLEIYAEKTYSEHGEHLVAKLPKFLYEKESEIERNYDKIATNSYVSVRTQNVFMMSVGR